MRPAEHSQETLPPDLTRRAVLTRVLAAAGAVCLEASAGPREQGPTLALVDGRSRVSRAFRHEFACESIDVSEEDRTAWRRLRCWRGAGRVVGLTRWSEYLQARAVLEERGMRLRREISHHDLIQWEMG